MIMIVSSCRQREPHEGGREGGGEADVGKSLLVACGFSVVE